MCSRRVAVRGQLSGPCHRSIWQATRNALAQQVAFLPLICYTIDTGTDACRDEENL